MTPLNVYLRDATPEAAADAILDYGAAIKDLAAANIFTGDMLLKNFGVSRHGRVIFYDYDELCLLTECNIPLASRSRAPTRRRWRPSRGTMWASTTFSRRSSPRFLVPSGPLRDVFLSAHADLLTVEYWRAHAEAPARGRGRGCVSVSCRAPAGAQIVSTSNEFDTVIVGLGAMGSAALYHLASRGVRCSASTAS